jgi:hypothetical protein
MSFQRKTFNIGSNKLSILLANSMGCVSFRNNYRPAKAHIVGESAPEFAPEPPPKLTQKRSAVEPSEPPSSESLTSVMSLTSVEIIHNMTMTVNLRKATNSVPPPETMVW